jgi:diguanylate cyclase (GGDEF)-like protein/PAS domain S-box-containing protein
MTSELHLLLSSVWDFMLDAVFLIDRHGIVVNVNNACESILGYRPDEMIGRPLAGFQVPEDRQRTEEEARRILAGKPRVGFENRYLHKNGKVVHLMWSARLLPERGLRIGVARDIGYRKLADLRNEASHAILTAAQEAADLPDLCRRVHRILAHLLPVELLAVVTAPAPGDVRLIYRAGQMAHDDDPKAWYARIGDGIGAVPATVLRFPRQFRINGAIFVRAPGPDGYTTEQRDLLRFVAKVAALAFERTQLHADLLHAACHDELTGLPNRRLFHDMLATALARCRRNGARLGLLFVDVDEFKQINDTLGHAAGDAVLRHVAQRLRHCARASDTVARLSGDEFVVILEDLAPCDDARAVTAKIEHAMATPVLAAGQTVRVALSLGLAFYPDDTQQADELLMRADAAMYAAKQDRKRRRLLTSLP